MKTFLMLLAVGAAAAGCASSSRVFRKPAVAQRCHNADLEGPLTTAPTPDASPYGGDPLKTFSCGAPPR